MYIPVFPATYIHIGRIIIRLRYLAEIIHRRINVGILERILLPYGRVNHGQPYHSYPY